MTKTLIPLGSSSHEFNPECAAAAESRQYADLAAYNLHHPPGRGQAESESRIILHPVQPDKGRENTLLILFGEANSVVLELEADHRPVPLGRNRQARRDSGLHVLDPVRYQVVIRNLHQRRV